MKTTLEYLAVFASLALLLTGTALADSGHNATHEFEFSDNSSEAESQLGDGVRAYNFVIRGLPAQAAVEGPDNSGEVDAEKEFERREADANTNFSVSQEEAIKMAKKELGSTEWNLESTDRDEEDGLYEFSFIRGESEAEVVVDASSGEVIALEGEVEYEPEERREEPVVSLSGFIVFNSGGYEVDVESEEENNNVDFTVNISEPEGMTTQAITRVPVKETEDVEPGTSNVNLQVVRNGETVLERNRELEIPDTRSEEDKEDHKTEFEQDPANMSRQELVKEVKELRERVRELEAELGDEAGEAPESPGPPGERDDEETEDGETENESGDDSEGTPSEAPGQGSNRRPGFVNNLLSGLFG